MPTPRVYVSELSKLDCEAHDGKKVGRDCVFELSEYQSLIDEIRGKRLFTEEELRVNRMEIEDILVEREGSDSEKYGAKLGLWPLWSAEKAEAIIQAARKERD